jgi:hypothetical protein
MLHTLNLPALLNYSDMPLDGISRGESQFHPGSEADEDISTSRDFQNLMSCDIYNFITLTNSHAYPIVSDFYLRSIVLTHSLGPSRAMHGLSSNGEEPYRQLQLVPQDQSRRSAYTGGWALKPNDSSTTCPSNVPVVCGTSFGLVKPECCPASQPCFGADTRGPYCCPISISLAIFCHHSVLIYSS